MDGDFLIVDWSVLSVFLMTGFSLLMEMIFYDTNTRFWLTLMIEATNSYSHSESEHHMPISSGCES